MQRYTIVKIEATLAESGAKLAKMEAESAEIKAEVQVEQAILDDLTAKKDSLKEDLEWMGWRHWVENFRLSPIA